MVGPRAGTGSSSLLRRLQVDRDLDVVAEHDAARLESLVPLDVVVGAIECGFDGEPGFGVPPRIGHLAQVGDRQGDRLRDTPHGEDAGDVERRLDVDTLGFEIDDGVVVKVLVDPGLLDGLRLDAEHALDPVYARKLGVNVDELLISQPDTGEQALEIAEQLVRSGALDILVVDDNSPDGTGELAEKMREQYDGCVDVLHRQEKNGLGPETVSSPEYRSYII